MSFHRKGYGFIALFFCQPADSLAFGADHERSSAFKGDFTKILSVHRQRINPDVLLLELLNGTVQVHHARHFHILNRTGG